MTRSSSNPSADFEDGERSSLGDVLEELREMVRDAEKLLRDTDGPVGERVSEVRSKIKEKLEDARGRLHEEGAGRLKSAARSTETYVRENPWTAVLIAAGVGFLIANMGRRR